ncbi:MAG: hypothetical protein GY715_00220 [Planctomycetes bacterium]|nr:hypothetical protein [Planctomycetota bacterium]
MISRLASLLAVALIVGGCATTGSTIGDPAFQEVAWLTGRWEGFASDGVLTEEQWMKPRAGSMLGMNRTMAGDRTVFFEYLRIEPTDDGGLVYLAAPKGRAPATPFTLVASGGGRLVFENLDHDYPQRIIYEYDRRRRGLAMRIEGVENGVENGVEKSADWQLRAVAR